MEILKYFMLLLTFGATTTIGFLFSKRYSSRVNELKEMKNALSIFETKIKFTYEPIPEAFREIAKKVNPNIGKIFKLASENMEYTTAGNAWIESLTVSQHNMKKEDIEVLKGLSRLLGKTDIEGQVSEITLVKQFLDTQIEQANLEKEKNAKMYKTLGVVAGLAIVIVLV